MFEIPDSVRSLFIEAGWFPGREMAVAESVPPLHPAAQLLIQYGGLRVWPARVTGREYGTSDLNFMALAHDAAVVALSEVVGSWLVGVAEVGGGHEELYMAADGRFFGRSLIHEAIYFEGASFQEALNVSLLGVRARPMLLPGQTSVSLYGVTYTADSSEIYWPANNGNIVSGTIVSKS